MSRELDVAIARVLGFEVQERTHFFDGYAKRDWMCIEDNGTHIVPSYSTDGNAMLKLDAEVRKRGWNLFLWNENDIWYAVYEEKGKEIEDEVEGVEGISGRIIPEAVAKAAYYALTGKGW